MAERRQEPLKYPLTRLGGEKFDLMSYFFDPTDRTEFSELIFSPLDDACSRARQRRDCRALPDVNWLCLGVHRVLSTERSGRGFLQLVADRYDCHIPTSLFFESLKSKRRLHLCQEVNADLAKQVGQCDDRYDPFSTESSLDQYDIYAGDGHYLEHACHDKRIQGHHRATGHFFAINMRSHALFRLATADQALGRKAEHDMHALKRLEAATLRQGAKTGRRVIWVWDRAGIDARFWARCKKRSGVYFVSRAKTNMDLTSYGAIAYDTESKVNRGVTGYNIAIIGGQELRRVTYVCPDTGQSYEFLTSLTQIEPGLIAALYLARWDIEKTFDETKRKLGESKSWASSETAKSIQAEMIAMTHNLLVLLERDLESRHDIIDEREERRRTKRKNQVIAKARVAGRAFPPLVLRLMLRSTQRVLRLIRWVRNNLHSTRPLSRLVSDLRHRMKVC